MISVVRYARIPYATIEDRAFVLYDHIFDSIIDWRTESPAFNGVAGWFGIIGKRSEEFFTDEGKERECRITIDLAVTARI